MVAPGYYAHSAITACWACILGAICCYRIERALQTRLTKMFFRVTPGVLFYALLVCIEAVDFEGLYGVYHPTVPSALRILETDTLVCCSFGAMHLVLCMAFVMEQKEVPAYVGNVFIVAAIVKVGIGVATAIAYLIVQRKNVMVYNDASLLIIFVVSICLFTWLCWQVQLHLAEHLGKAESQILRNGLVKMRRVLVLSAISALAVPGFLAYNVWDHAQTGNVVERPPDSSVYTVGYSVWFKLIWATFLLWLSRPEKQRETATEVESHAGADHNGVELQPEGNPQSGPAERAEGDRRSDAPLKGDPEYEA